MSLGKRTRGDVRGGWRPRAGGRARGARVDRGGGGTRLLLVVEAGGGGGGEYGVQARVRVELLRQLAHARVRRVRRRRHGAVGVNAPAPMCVHMCVICPTLTPSAALPRAGGGAALVWAVYSGPGRGGVAWVDASGGGSERRFQGCAGGRSTSPPRQPADLLSGLLLMVPWCLISQSMGSTARAAPKFLES